MTDMILIVKDDFEVLSDIFERCHAAFTGVPANIGRFTSSICEFNSPNHKSKWLSLNQESPALTECEDRQLNGLDRLRALMVKLKAICLF